MTYEEGERYTDEEVMQEKDTVSLPCRRSVRLGEWACLVDVEGVVRG